MENTDISKIKRKNNSPQTKKLLKIYQEGHLNKLKCPTSLFNIIITIIILFVFIIIILILKFLFFIIFFIFLKHNPKNYDKKNKNYHDSVINYSTNFKYVNSTKEGDTIFFK